MRIAIVGAGGVGGYFGGRLARAGEDVAFVARGATLDALRRRGLRVESVAGDFTVEPVKAEADPASIGPVDAVLVAVKAWQVEAVAPALAPLIGPGTVVVPLENGVEAPDQLAAVLGRGSVLGGLCRISSMIVEPGHIRHAGLEPYVALGELGGGASERAERLRAAFEHAGVRAEVPADIRVAMWQKFLFITAVSGLGAVTRAPVGVLRSLRETRELLVAAVEEVAAVGRALGVAIPGGAVAATLALVDSLPEHTTASMQRDVAAGNPSELEAQNGAVVRLGAAAGVPTPVNGFLHAALLPQELAARGPAA